MALNFKRVLRQHLPFVVIVPLLIIGMTWPTAVHVFDTGELWLPRRDIDINMLFWDAWYFKRLLAGQADFYYTDLQFHPEGVSLAFHNFSLPHMAVFAGLQAFLPPFNAFNLTYLILVYLTALASYVFFFHLFRDKWLSLVGSVVFGLGTLVLDLPGKPSVWFVGTLPLALLYFQRGMSDNRWVFMLVSGALVGVTAFIGMYALVCMLITFVFFSAYYARSMWRDLSYWYRILALLLVASVFIVARVYPMVADSGGLSEALSKHSDRETGNDLLGYFANYTNPITRPVFETVFGSNPVPSNVYLGYIPILFVIAGVVAQRRHSRVWLWLLLLLTFLTLRLGSTLTINDVQYKDIRLPKYYFELAFPHLFKPFWSNDNFQAGVLLPFAILTCYGLKAILQRVSAKQHPTFVVFFLALVALEYYHGTDPKIIPKQQFEYIDWLKTEPNQDAIHLINLPMGGQHSKYYDFHQTVTGYPQVEGRPTRTPSAAFHYIKNNALLNAWRNGKSFHCLPSNRAAFEAALSQLLADEFSHVILHKWRDLGTVLRNRFTGAPYVFDDYFATIYRLEDLNRGCDHRALINLNPHLTLSGFVESNVVIPESGAAALSIHPGAALGGALLEYYLAAETDPQSLLPLNIGDLHSPRIASGELQRFEPQTALTSKEIVLLVHDPGGTGQALLSAYRGWIGERFQACDPYNVSDGLVVTPYLQVGYACDLIADGQPFAVRYDSGVRMGNLLYEVSQRNLDLQFLWAALPEKSQAFSIQLLDFDGRKAYGQDFVIGLESLAQYRVDLSSLAPGDYAVKMIVYDYETGKSVPGTVSGSDTRFERELEFARLTIE